MRIRFLGRFLPALILAALPVAASAGAYIGVSVDVPPPPLPVYVQPPCPQPGYIWAPGYWAWGPFGYYWVPGTWVLPPQVGLFWTPGYWAWNDDAYLWHAGYWGPSVGFYGGIDYGFGYDGDGFDGGFWRGGVFFYNRAVMNVGPHFDDDYYRRPPHHPDFDRGRFRHVSFNGGPGGILAHPNRMDRIAARGRRFGLTPEQRRHDFMARGDRVLRANFNHGRPPVAATAHPSVFRGHGVFAARAAGGRFVPHRSRPMPVYRPMRRPADRPAWAASRRDTALHGAWQRHWRAPAHRGGPPAFRGGNRFAPHRWTGPQYTRRPAHRAAPRFHTGPAPQFRDHPAFQSRYRPAPHFQARPAPHFQARPAPHFQARPAPHFQARPAPHFQARAGYHGPERGPHRPPGRR